MQVAFVGLGTMGAPMASRLLNAGHHLTVHNRTREREEPLVEMGASRAASPAEAAAGAEVVVLMLSDTPDVEQVLLGADGVLENAAPGTTVVDMSTISPEATRRVGEQLSKSDVRLVDAPVSGGPEGAAGGTLAIMAGGDEEDVKRVRPILDELGRVTHVGPLGAGQATKAVNQVIVGGFYLALAEGLVLGIKQGLDMDRVIEAISGGACRSWILENRATNVLQNQYPLGFRLSLHLKDLKIALTAAQEVGAELPLATMISDIEGKLVAEGFGDEDVSAIARDIRRRADT